MLKHFDKRALKRLHLLIQSPYFNKKEAVTRYYQFLLPNHPEFQATAVEDKKAYAYVFPQAKYKEKEIGYLMSDLVKLIERFLIIEQVDQNPLLGKAQLMEIYDQWDLDKAFNKTIRDSHKILKDSKHRHQEFFYHSFILYSQENNYFDKQKKHKMDDSLQLAIDHLDLYYISQKLRYCCEMTNRKNVVVSQYDIRLVDELLSFLEKDPMADEPAVAIYHNILLSLKEPDSSDRYQKVRALLEAHSDLFPLDEARGMFLYVVNYCVNKVHSGKSEFLGELLSIYKLILEKKYVLDNGFISPWTYMNICTAGIRNNEYEWTEKFIKDYKKHLHPKFASNAYSFNLAYLFFNQEKYQKAQELLHQVELDDIFYTSESKELLLRIYYKMEEVDAFYSLAESFQVFIRRNKLISQQKKDMYSNLIKFLRRLFKIGEDNRSSLVRLKTDIEATPRISKKSWLIMQVNENIANVR